VGCAPADVAGDYTAATTNEANECGFDTWNEGDTQSGIPVVVTQNGTNAELEVQGIWGGALQLAYGRNTFTGEVGGSHVHATLVGTRSVTQGNCTYSVTLELDADLTGDTLQGQVVYQPQTNHDADCEVLDSCSNVQRFNATRPPT
jgi:hypothetical protein